MMHSDFLALMFDEGGFFILRHSRPSIMARNLNLNEKHCFPLYDFIYDS
jgi:hypothetical protein